jgi:hypothetical protein
MTQRTPETPEPTRKQTIEALKEWQIALKAGLIAVTSVLAMMEAEEPTNA